MSSSIATEIEQLSVVVPCFNENATLEKVIASVLAAETCGLEREVIIVDDGSDDGSRETGRGLAAKHTNVRFFEHERNMGKGAAVRTGFREADGDIILVQDADLEYDPADYRRLLRPILEEGADVVIGTRFRSGEAVRVLYYWHRVVNAAITTFSNMFTNVNLTDIECCYKVFRRDIIERIELKENRFGIEPELCAKICRLKPLPRIYEVGVSYRGRTYEEGKKIGWKDGVRAIYCIVRYNLFP